MKQVFYFWLRPTETIAAIQLEEPDQINRKINLLLISICLYASLQMPEDILKSIRQDTAALPYILKILLILFLFLFFKYVVAFVLWTFCKLFQGIADIQQIRLVQSYSMSPYLVLLPFACIQLIVKLCGYNTSITGNYSTLFRFVFSILVLRFTIIGLCRVNKFSFGYGLLTVILTYSIPEFLKLILGK
jgi:hypothetical protein